MLYDVSSSSLGDYGPYHEQNSSCGKQSSEVGRNCTNYGKYGAVRYVESINCLVFRYSTEKHRLYIVVANQLCENEVGI